MAVAGVLVGVVDVVVAGSRVGAGFQDCVCFRAIGPETALGNRRFKEQKWDDDGQGADYHGTVGCC